MASPATWQGKRESINRYTGGEMSKMTNNYLMLGENNPDIAAQQAEQEQLQADTWWQTEENDKEYQEHCKELLESEELKDLQPF
jgi:hypothetical protein